MRRRYSLLATAGTGVADRPPAAGSAIAVTPIARRRLARTSLQVGGDLLEAGLYAGFVLFAARSAGGAGRADHLLADFDRQRAARGGEAGKIPAMAVCAMVSAMAADTSLRVSNCALAGVAKAQASAMPPQR